MSDIAICDYFKWSLEDLRNLNFNEYRHVIKYMKKIESENKKSMRKAKRR